ncbi:MAG TPA: NAD-dependent epimerase/dehydratase family protein [Candidatus Binatia bacterium]|nr:NAD-dependent epimerase/dehydratase family protein [Candidatus Binatia bacterium]
MHASADPVLVTGGTGFIAAGLIQALAPTWNVRASQRREAVGPQDYVVGEMGAGADWRRALEGVGTVIHLAGPSNSYFPDDVLRRGIVGGTQELLEQATMAGVRRFIFVSSMKACADSSEGPPLREDGAPRPSDAYGRSKLEAERIVLERPAINPIVLRPPLVYAASAKGNLSKFLSRLDTPAPLPFGGVKNQRSLIALPSLLEAIIAVLQHESEPVGVFHVADEPAVSTPQMAMLLRQGMGRPSRLFAMPGFEAFAPPPLVRSLAVDTSKFRATFNYSGIDTREGLVACGKAWRDAH